MTVNVLSLARRLLSGHKEPSAAVRANVMYFQKGQQQNALVMWLNSDVQSYESAVEPWIWPVHSADQVANGHPAFCVRAFLKNQIEVVSDMSGAQQRHGEPLAGMIAIPTELDRNIHAVERRNFDLAVVNIVSEQKRVIPSKLSEEQRQRAKLVASLARKTNEFRQIVRIIRGPQHAIGADFHTARSGESGNNKTTDDQSYQQLFQKALESRSGSYSPYSKFAVGAAVQTESGEIFTGANIENKSYGLTICAERVAVQGAVAKGYTRFRAVAVAGPNGVDIEPCGACRQVLAEFAPKGDLDVIRSREDGTAALVRLSQLLPFAFDLRDPPVR